MHAKCNVLLLRCLSLLVTHCTDLLRRPYHLFLLNCRSVKYKVGSFPLQLVSKNAIFAKQLLQKRKPKYFRANFNIEAESNMLWKYTSVIYMQPDLTEFLYNSFPFCRGTLWKDYAWRAQSMQSVQRAYPQRQLSCLQSSRELQFQSKYFSFQARYFNFFTNTNK